MSYQRQYNICRLCLCDGRLIDIYEENMDFQFIVAEAIKDLLQIPVVQEIGFPWLICQNCFERLSEFRFFKIRCQESQTAFEMRFRDQSLNAGRKNTEQEATETGEHSIGMGLDVKDVPLEDSISIKDEVESNSEEITSEAEESTYSSLDPSSSHTKEDANSWNSNFEDVILPDSNPSIKVEPSDEEPTTQPVLPNYVTVTKTVPTTGMPTFIVGSMLPVKGFQLSRVITQKEATETGEHSIGMGSDVKDVPLDDSISIKDEVESNSEEITSEAEESTYSSLDPSSSHTKEDANSWNSNFEDVILPDSNPSIKVEPSDEEPTTQPVLPNYVTVAKTVPTTGMPTFIVGSMLPGKGFQLGHLITEKNKIVPEAANRQPVNRKVHFTVDSKLRNIDLSKVPQFVMNSTVSGSGANVSQPSRSAVYTKKMAKWSQEATELLIHEVKKRPFLYQVKNPRYHHRLARKKAMLEIAREVSALRENTSGEEVKARWNALRSGFQANLAKIRGVPNGNIYSGYQVWYFDLLTFLKDSLPSRKIYSNVASDVPSELSSNASQTNEAALAESVKEPQNMEPKHKKRKAEDEGKKSLSGNTKNKKSTDWAFRDRTGCRLVVELEDMREKLKLKREIDELVMKHKK